MKAVKKTANKKRLGRVPAPTETALNLVGDVSDTDVNGSYTGIPKDRNDRPIQDADDL